MDTNGFKGRDFLKETDFSPREIKRILEVAEELKLQNEMGTFHDDKLRAKTLFMLFYNQSLRTRNSFECGMTELGGHAHFLDPNKIYTPALEGKEVAYRFRFGSYIWGPLSSSLSVETVQPGEDEAADS